MKAIICALIIGLMTSIAMAGEIYGTILDSGSAVPAGVKVEVAVAGKSYTGTTDNLGAYRVFAAEKGKGTLTVYHKNQKPAAEVFSFEKATRYDWTIETVDGKPVLKRK